MEYIVRALSSCGLIAAVVKPKSAICQDHTGPCGIKTVTGIETRKNWPCVYACMAYVCLHGLRCGRAGLPLFEWCKRARVLNETTRILERSNSKVTRDLECEHSNSRMRVLDCQVLITREYKKNSRISFA